MGEHRAKRLRVECPICHEAIEVNLLDHLLETHTKEELAVQVRSYHEADEQGTLV